MIICRVQIIENTYLSSFRDHVLSSSEERFEAELVRLCSQILEYQARALCYVQKHRVAKIVNDMLKRDGWDALIQDMSKIESSILGFVQLLDASEVRSALAQQELQVKSWQPTIDALIDKLETARLTQEASGKETQLIKLIKMLYTCPYAARKDMNNERIEGTCEWFTNHPQSKYWISHGRLLWVSADPGCGKSVLAKYLVDRVLPEPDSIICYFFFKDDFSDQKTSANAICALLRQLLVEKPQRQDTLRILDDYILQKADEDGEKFTQSFKDVWDAFVSVVVRNSKPVICVLDALDECQESDRAQLIKAILDFNYNKVKFLMTSRPYAYIKREFQDLKSKMPMIHLSGEEEAEVEKISQEISIVVRKRVEDIGKQRLLEYHECDFLQTQLETVKNRTYLWVQLTLDVIASSPGFTRGNVLRSIHRIPQTVEDAYESILNRSPEVNKARRLLHIILGAARPLSLSEMSLALAIDDQHTAYRELKDDIEPDNRFKDTVRDLCGLFVVIVDSKLYLLHQTAREFLLGNEVNDIVNGTTETWRHSVKQVDSDRVIADACLRYINLQDFDTCERVFHAYSAQYWFVHFKDAGIQSEDYLTQLALEACDPRLESYAVWSLLDRLDKNDSTYNTPLQVASYLGIEALVKMLLGQNADDEWRTRRGETPLWLAAQHGHEAIIKLLLQHGAEVDAKDDYYRWTPLSIAAQRGHEKAASLLLKHNAHVDARCDGYTPLVLAVSGGHHAVVDLLLDHGADIDFQDTDEMTSLSWAIRYRLNQVSMLLLKRGADPDLVDRRHGRTALGWAAAWGETWLVKLLLDHGADPAKVNHKDMSPRAPDIKELLQTALKAR